MEGLEAIALAPMIRGLGWQKQEVDVFLAGVRKAYVDRSTHSYMPFYIIYGQKPGAGQVPTYGSTTDAPEGSGPIGQAI